MPAEEVTQRITRAYVELNRQVNIPISPRQVPLALLENAMPNRGRGCDPSPGSGLLREAVRQQEWCRSRRDSPVGPVKIKKNEPLLFTATVEIRPNIELRTKAPSPISLNPTSAPSPTNSSPGPEVLREQQARLEATAPATPLCGDYIVLDVSRHARWSTAEGRRKKVSSTRSDHTRLSWV